MPRFRFRTLLATSLITIAQVSLLQVVQQPSRGLRADVSDRLIANNFPEHQVLKLSTEVPSISPAYKLVRQEDLVVKRTDLVKPKRMALVVRKPVRIKTTYRLGAVPDEGVYAYLRAELERAQELGVGNVIFPKDATLKIRNPNANALHMELDGFRDTVIDLNGCTLIFENATPGIVIKNCQRIVLKNGTLKGTPLIATIARVQPYSSQIPNAGIRFEVLPEFRQPLVDAFAETHQKPPLQTVGNAKVAGNSWRFDAVNAVDLFTNRGGQTDLFSYNFETASFRSVSPSSRRVPPYKMGQLVYLLHHNNAGHGITLKNSDADVEDITLSSLQLRNISGMGIVGEVNRGLHIQDVTIAPDESNPLSIWGSSSDGIHINNNGGDILIEDSKLLGSADDLITAKGNYWRIIQLDRATNRIVVAPADRQHNVRVWGKRGHRLVIINGGFRVVGTTVLMRDANEIKNRTFELTLRKMPTNLAVGNLVANPDLAGGRIIIRNNYLSTTRAQGILAQASNLIIENNLLSNTSGPAIKISARLEQWYEGVQPRNMLIKNNEFYNTGVGLDKRDQGALYIAQEDEQGNPVQVIDYVQLQGNIMKRAARRTGRFN